MRPVPGATTHVQTSPLCRRGRTGVRKDLLGFMVFSSWLMHCRRVLNMHLSYGSRSAGWRWRTRGGGGAAFYCLLSVTIPVTRQTPSISHGTHVSATRIRAGRSSLSDVAHDPSKTGRGRICRRYIVLHHTHVLTGSVGMLSRTGNVVMIFFPCPSTKFVIISTCNFSHTHILLELVVCVKLVYI